MTTTPETPALPGDLTDETIERAAIAVWQTETTLSEEFWRHIAPGMQETYRGVARAALAAARVAPAPHETMHVRCDCVPDHGPAHCHDCNVPYSECRTRVAPVTPSESDWLLILMPDSGAHRTREWRGRAVDADAAIERAMDENPGWSVHTFGPDVNAKPAPSPNREKQDAARAEAERRFIPLDRPTAVSEQCAVQGFVDGAEWAAALAVPPVVDKAKLAEIIEEARDRSRKDRDITKESLGQFVVRLAVERQREWLGGAA